MANSIDRKYESSTLGAVILVRMKSAEAAAYTGEPGDAVKVHAFNGGSKRRFGIRARGVVLKRLVGTAPEQRTVYTFLPAGTEAALATLAASATVTIATVVWTVVRGEAEIAV